MSDRDTYNLKKGDSLPQNCSTCSHYQPHGPAIDEPRYICSVGAMQHMGFGEKTTCPFYHLRPQRQESSLKGLEEKAA